MSDSSQPHELYRPPGSSVHGILQTRILEWVAISFSRGSSQPRDWTGVACIAGRLFTIWATREDSGLKSRYITLLTEVQLVKAMVFPVVMYWYESWTVKQVWALRTDALELWFWKRLLRLPWTARRSNQSIKGNQPWIFIRRTDAEAPILWSLNATAYSLKRKRPCCWKRLKARGEGVAENERVKKHHQLNGQICTKSRRQWRTEESSLLQSMGYKKSDTT